MLTSHAVALEWQSIAKAPALIPVSTDINSATSAANLWADKKEEAFKPTAQVAKIMLAIETDGDLEQLWAEIEMENKNMAAASETMHELSGQQR